MSSPVLFASLAAVLTAAAHPVTIVPVARLASTLAPLPMATVGRVQRAAGGALLRQWPGTYFETAFRGPNAFFRLGPGEVSVRVTVDGGAAVPLSKPASGTYRVSGLGGGKHRLRISVASESQARPTVFGGFFAGRGTSPAPLPRRNRAIEFIGDSHTVGYGNTSVTRQCTEDEIWATTDTSRGVAAITAAHYGADYEVNAISGRGVVRNYNGFAADTLPQVYPFVLFDKAQRAAGPGWRPQVIVVALGTNDFSTPLNPGEKWTSRADLRSDFEASYVRFVEQLRSRNPRAYVLLWIVGAGNSEGATEVARVVDRLHKTGDRRIGFVAVTDLALSGCNYHPSVADDAKIAAALEARLDGHRDAWRR